VRSAAPYAVLGAGIRTAAGISGGESAEVQRKRLLRHVQQYVKPPDRAVRVAAFLGEIAGVPFPDEHLPGLRGRGKTPALWRTRRSPRGSTFWTQRRLRSLS
jgi:hypothetical protein